MPAEGRQLIGVEPDAEAQLLGGARDAARGLEPEGVLLGEHVAVAGQPGLGDAGSILHDHVDVALGGAPVLLRHVVRAEEGRRDLHRVQPRGLGQDLEALQLVLGGQT